MCSTWLLLVVASTYIKGGSATQEKAYSHNTLSTLSTSLCLTIHFCCSVESADHQQRKIHILL
jgi:hypothetical protein